MLRWGNGGVGMSEYEATDDAGLHPMPHGVRIVLKDVSQIHKGLIPFAMELNLYFPFYFC